jgi:cytochrome c553
MCRSRLRVLALAVGIAVCAASLLAAQTSTGDQLMAQGALSYTFYCAACHGANGGGNSAEHAPQLAGRPVPALVRQIAGLRAPDPASAAAAATNAHARALAALSAANIQGIAAYLASLAPPPPIAH